MQPRRWLGEVPSYDWADICRVSSYAVDHYTVDASCTGFVNLLDTTVNLHFSCQVPEPDAEGLVQLREMGFSAGLAAKALLLSHNVPAAALEWALQHSEDADADASPSEDALRAGGATMGFGPSQPPPIGCNMHASR